MKNKPIKISALLKCPHSWGGKGGRWGQKQDLSSTVSPEISKNAQVYGKNGEGGSATSNLRTERWACTLPEPTGETDKLHSYFKDISATETRKAIPFQLYKEKKRQQASLAWPFVIF